MAVKETSENIAIRVTEFVGTVSCMWLFALIPFFGFVPGLMQVENWVSSNFLQLFLLAVLANGQRIQANRIDDLHAKHDSLHDKLGNAI